MSQRAITKAGLADWFLPGDIELTESLVRRSGLNRLREFSQLTAYVASRPGFEEFRPEALATLEAFDAEPVDVLFRRLASPVFRGWLSTFGGVKEYRSNDPVLESRLRLWNNMRYSLVLPGEWRATMQVVDGCLMTWDTRGAVWVGNHDQVVVARAGRRLTVSAVDGGSTLVDLDLDAAAAEEPRHAAPGCADLGAGRLPETEIVVRNDLPLLRLQLSPTAQREDGVVFGAVDPNPESYPPFDAAPFVEAAAILADAWPEEYDDFRQTLQVVVPRAAPPGWRARGMTVSSHQGAIWIFVREILDLVEHMTHEQSHVKLRYIEETSPLLAPDQTEERFLVGWRKDPRPIVGIYEGVYVHLHVLLALAACAERGSFSGAVADQCRTRLETLRAEVREGIDLLRAHGRFTDSGQAYLEWAESCLEAADGAA